MVGALARLSRLLIRTGIFSNSLAGINEVLNSMGVN
jgi:hypothetical protein